MKFYVGLHQPSDAKHFDRCMISINRIRNRKSHFKVGEWMMDSGAFTEIKTHGHYRQSAESYAKDIKKWWSCGYLAAAVSQDFPCEPFVLEKTGMSILEHQKLTIERYRYIKDQVGMLVYVMPVLQGRSFTDYMCHIEMYGELLKENQWVGVGSLCKRNSSPDEIDVVLSGIKMMRPDLRLHGFGVKSTALNCKQVREKLWSADSMAWSYAARREGRDANDWKEAEKLVNTLS